MNRTKIEYLDYTLNWIVGCSGENCAVRDKCWARRMAKRQSCTYCKQFIPHMHVSRLNDAFQIKKSKRIGLNFMGETFDRILPETIPRAINVMLQTIVEAKQHTFLILTKQPQNIPNDLEFPDNVWLGVSVNRKQDLRRIQELTKKRVKLKFVSFEPLYEDLSDADLTEIDWIIVGCQTRPTLLPSYPWVLGLIQKAKRFNIPVFIKNNLKEVMARWPPLQEYPQ